MSSRNAILSAVKANQPELVPLPDMQRGAVAAGDVIEQYSTVLTAIGGRILEVTDISAVAEKASQLFGDEGRKISSFSELEGVAEYGVSDPDPHALHDVHLAILKADLGVAENGALWVPETNMIARALPFICQHLALVLDRSAIVPDMHAAYTLLGTENPGFGTFIAGPSKTADIEQSLVLGAHGPRSLTVFLL